MPSRNIVFVNQACGFITIDIINAFAEKFGKVAVIYGDIRVQDVPLNPITANGHCGRLKCCLAFECEQYREAGMGMPESGSLVRCVNEAQDAEGMVVGRDVMRGRLTVRTREGRFLTVTKEDIHVARASRSDTVAKGEDTNEDSVSEWTEP